MGFRAFVARVARERGVVGEVRNTDRGAVEIVAEGETAALEAFLDEVRTGPSFARVEEVDVVPGEGTGRYRGFTVSG